MFQRLHTRRAGFATVVGFLALSGCASAPEMTAACDRACLSGMLTQYADALAAHDPSMLPLADDVRFTENSQELTFGEGLWETATATGGFRQDYLDTDKQIAASHMVMLEGDEAHQALLTVVLHLDAREIAGVETLVQHITPESRFQPRELGAPIRGMNTPVPADKKETREEMIRTALTYPEGLRIGDFSATPTPFAPETYRVENGFITAGEGCGREDCGMYAQQIMLHPTIAASIAAVDEENGVVLLWMNFGYTGSYGEGNSLVTFEAFKIWGGEIHAINAFFPILPVGTSRGWPSSDPIPDWKQAP